MLVFTDNIRELVLWSLCAGALICLLYDVIRVSRAALGVSSDVEEMKGKPLFIIKFIYLFLTDFIFCVVCAIGFLITAYYVNGGRARGLIVICAIVGFALIRLTVSRLVVFILLKLASALKWMLRVALRIALKITAPIFSLYHLTLGRFVCIIKDRIKKKRDEIRARKEALIEATGKEENVATEENMARSEPKKRIVIGRRAEKL